MEKGASEEVLMVGRDNLDPAGSAKLEEIALSIDVALRSVRQEQHPIQADMLAAIFKCALEMIRLGSLPGMTLQEFGVRAAPLAREVNELATWLVDPRSGPPVSEIRADIDIWVSSYVSAGLKGTSEYAEILKKAWLGRPKGRPAVQRQAAVRALEMKLANPDLT
jgi:hypothetical protein